MRRAGRVRALIGVLAVVVAAVFVSCAFGTAAFAQSTSDTAPDPTTDLPSSTTTTTQPSPPSSTTSTTVPPSTSSTTAPPPSSSGDGRADSAYVPSAAEASAARAAFVQLTDGQRALLERLQQARDDLTAARAAVLDVSGKVANARSRLTSANRDAQAAEAEETQAAGRLRRLRADMASLAGAVYEHLGDDVLLDTVNTADRTEMNRLRTYARAPQDALDTLVEQARRTRAQVADARGRAHDAQAAAARLVDTLQSLSDAQRLALAGAEHASSDAEAAVTAALGSNVVLLGQVADPHFGADDITVVLATAQAGDPDPVTLLGAFHPPVDAPLGSPYGIRVDPLTGSIGYHPGVDFEAAAGTPVHAAAGGVVVMASDCGGYGNCVVIDHGYSLATVSAHLSRVLVTVGQPVSDGQVVGLVGSTGMSTGPHLHFEVRLHGAPIDPLPTLAS